MADADYTLSVDVIGAAKIKAVFDRADKICVNALKDALNITAYKLEYKARPLAPHDTGTLRSSIHADQDPGHLAVQTLNNVEAAVGTKVKYARAQEYGTVGMTIHSHSKLGTQFNYIGNIRPKFYMKQAKESMRPEMTLAMQGALRVIIRELSL